MTKKSNLNVTKLEERIAPSLLGGLLSGSDGGSGGDGASYNHSETATADGSHASVGADGNGHTGDVGQVDVGGIGHGNSIGNGDLVIGNNSLNDAGHVSDVGHVTDAGNVSDIGQHILNGDNGNITDAGHVTDTGHVSDFADTMIRDALNSQESR